MFVLTVIYSFNISSGNSTTSWKIPIFTYFYCSKDMWNPLRTPLKSTFRMPSLSNSTKLCTLRFLAITTFFWSLKVWDLNVQFFQSLILMRLKLHWEKLLGLFIQGSTEIIPAITCIEILLDFYGIFTWLLVIIAWQKCVSEVRVF